MKKNTHNHKHLTLSDRTFIEQELIRGSTFKAIADTLGKDPTTISKEVKLHRIITDEKPAKNKCYKCTKQKRCGERLVCGKSSCKYSCRFCRQVEPTEYCHSGTCHHEQNIKLYSFSVHGVRHLYLAACTTTAPEADNNEPVVTEAAPTEAPETTPEEAPEEEVVEDVVEDVIDKPDFTGIYTEPISGRCTIEIEHISGDDHKVTVQWSGSAYESANWEMNATYYVSTGLLEYTGAKYYIRTYTEDGDYTDDVKYTDGAGEFWFEEDGSLGWRSANSDIDGIKGETFERLPENNGMANPWSDAASAEAAAEGAEVGYFMVPENKEYNNQIVYIASFRYMEHLAEAEGSIGAAELVIRKGLKQESEDVSGDYNEYAYNWSFESNEGFVINCYGNEEGKTMKAIWLSDNFSYSIFVRGQGDESDTYGLNEDTMKILVELIQ